MINGQLPIALACILRHFSACKCYRINARLNLQNHLKNHQNNANCLNNAVKEDGYKILLPECSF